MPRDVDCKWSPHATSKLNETDEYALIILWTQAILLCSAQGFYGLTRFHYLRSLLYKLSRQIFKASGVPNDQK